MPTYLRVNIVQLQFFQASINSLFYVLDIRYDFGSDE